MIVTNINKKDDKFLHVKTVPLNLAKTDPKEIKKLVQEMRRIMKEANGIGLSANQIGLSSRLFVAQVPDRNGRQKFYAVINPEITKVSSEKRILEEACLSVPQTYGTVERHLQITLEGYTPAFKKIKIKAWGLLAHVFQHEVDHLNGVLFVDKAKDIRNYENERKHEK